MEALRKTGSGQDRTARPVDSGIHQQSADSRVDLIALHESNPERYPHLLESSAQGRFDILFAFPGESLTLDRMGKLDGPAAAGIGQDDFLHTFDRWWESLRTSAPVSEALPFTGGWFVYLGYELAGQIESRLQLPTPAGPLPVAVATRFTTAIVHDHELDSTSIVAETGQQALLEQIAADIAALPRARAQRQSPVSVSAFQEAHGQHYLDAVARILDYIREGDVFQVNLSRLWQLELDGEADVANLYRRLRQHNPAPFGGLARWRDTAIISSSPERLIQVRGHRIETRPIAGTRPRSRVAAADTAYSEELMAHPKERAEHIMLIDLERNDLGRICVPGSIEVNEFMVLESYAHVHHIVSNVRGALRDRIRPGEVIRAVFPGGTITGCPKVRCMEIIAELEGEAREAYTGSMGYINRDGSMDLNILIRTMLSAGRNIQLRAGAGIVADSVPVAELEETRAKARGLLHALDIGTD